MKLIDANTGDNIFTQPSSTTPIAWATIKVSCSDLQGSVSSSNSQYNINAYMLKNGLWNNMGEGYVVSGINNSTPKNKDSVCNGTAHEYVRVGIYNPDTTSISLAYPLNFIKNTNAKKFCAEVDFIDNNTGKLITDSINYFYKGGYGRATNGIGKINVVGSTGNKTTQLFYYNPFTSELEWTDVTLGDNTTGCSK